MSFIYSQSLRIEFGGFINDLTLIDGSYDIYTFPDYR